MYINLTNASPQHKGTKIAINADAIMTVHSGIVTREDETIDTVTFVFCPPHGTWEVTESYDEVLDLLNPEPTVSKSCKNCK